jgi:dolichyl-diphosphooligosaccharide--protein glycosyltransferase
MTKKESKIVETKKSSEEKVSKVKIKSSKKVTDSLKLNFKKLNFQSKIFNVSIAFLFIMLSMWVAWDVRDGAINLDGLDKNIESSIYSNVRGIISQEVNSQYPNLNEIYKEEKIAKEYAVVVETGKFNYQGQELIISDLVEGQAQSYKDQFKADNGQTYLTAIDPYSHIGLAKNYHDNGHMGTSLDENGNSLVEYKLAPVGVKWANSPDFHVWIESILFKYDGLNSDSSIGELTKSVFVLSSILATLSAIPIFLIIRHFSNNLFALFGTLILLTVGTFVSRTVAGFVDTDAYQILFPLCITVSLVYALISRNKILNILLSTLSGFFFGLFIWSWGNGWFFFVFILTSLFGYLLFKLISNYLNKNKSAKETLTNQGLTILTFLISTFIFVKLLASQNILQNTIKGLSGGLGGITSVATSNIWPNVLTSVAELNPASFGQIISSVGGALVFLIAMTALVFLVLEYIPSNSKQKLYKRLVIIFSFIWTILFINNIFTFLIANSPFLFIGLLFLPVAAALTLALINSNTSIKIFMSILLSIWMAGTIYMSFNGVRFILLLAPAFAISAGIGLYYIYLVCNNFFEKELKPKSYVGKQLGGLLVSSIIFLTIFTPMYTQAQLISDNTVPNFNDQWYDAMEKIKTETSEKAIITSWWDFGHFFSTVSERGTTFDGGSQTTPRSHWVGKLLMENNESVSQDILKMLVCGGNEAHNTLLSFTKGSTADAIKINKILYRTFGENQTETRNILVENGYYTLTDSQVDEVMELLSCDVPSENLLITSNDMIGKAGVWAHWGSWDFEKKYVSDFYKTKSSELIVSEIDADIEVVQTYIDELNDIDLRVKTQNIKRSDLINQWYAPYPSYVPIQGNYYVPCQINNGSSIVCAQGIEVESVGIDMKIKSIANEQITIKNIVYPTQLGTLKTSLNDPDGQFDLMLIPSGNTYQSVLAQSPLGASLFSRLYFYNGYGSTHFELFDAKTNGNNNPLTIWSTLWEPKLESEIIAAALAKLQPIVDDIVVGNETDFSVSEE